MMVPGYYFLGDSQFIDIWPRLSVDLSIRYLVAAIFCRIVQNILIVINCGVEVNNSKINI